MKPRFSSGFRFLPPEGFAVLAETLVLVLFTTLFVGTPPGDPIAFVGRNLAKADGLPPIESPPIWFVYPNRELRPRLGPVNVVRQLTELEVDDNETSKSSVKKQQINPIPLVSDA